MLAALTGCAAIVRAPAPIAPEARAAMGLIDDHARSFSDLRTLTDVVAYMSARLPAAPRPAAPRPETAAPGPGPALGTEVLTRSLLEVVSEKTGYPVDMLELDMAVEADLGIDSIKRVEILSEMTDRAPGLPALETSELAALATLGQVVDYLDQKLAATRGVAEAVAPAVSVTAPPATAEP